MRFKMDFTNFATSAQKQGTGHDEGLRKFMLWVYNHMGLGLAVSGFVAYFVAGSPQLLQLFFGGPQSWLFMLAPFGFILALSFGINKMSPRTATLVFYAYAAVMGISLSGIFLMYTSESIARIFFITAAIFGAMSIWGYTTKRDLTAMGSLLIMALIGVIVASLVNIFIGSSALGFGLSILTVLIFVGLTAYDTQKLKDMYYEVGGTGDVAARVAIMGALNLYLDFINIMLALLRLFGERR